MVPMPKNLNSLSKEEIRNFLDSFDTVLSDCDGVLWLENIVIEGSQHVINKFVKQKKTLFYVTNNNSKTREEYVEKCSKLGFAADKENIICTAYLATQYLKSINFDKKVYVLGSEGITKELDKAGIKHTGIGPDVLDTTLEDYISKKLKLDPNIGAVLQGFDQYFSYPKILKAATYLRDRNVHFIATCPDESFPVSSKLVLPGTGCFVRCLEAVSGRKAFILGKPNDYIKEAILKKKNLDPSRTLMIGDRKILIKPEIAVAKALGRAAPLVNNEAEEIKIITIKMNHKWCNTDILFGKRCGFQTLLVLTGVTSLSDVENYANSTDPNENDLVPQFYINKLGDLLPYM